MQPNISHLVLAAGSALALSSCVTSEPSRPFGEFASHTEFSSNTAYYDRSTSYHESEEPRYKASDGHAFWDPTVTGPMRIEIDLSEQTAYIYRGGRLAGQTVVATGRSGHDTPTGSYSILAKEREKKSNLYGQIFDINGNVINDDADIRTDPVPRGGKFVGAKMPYWMRLTGSGIGMHYGVIPNPGSPASHGCIRLPWDMAEILYENASLGTPVSIVH